MQGFQVTFFTEEGRHHGRKRVHVWLMEVAKSLGITGITTAVGVQGIGRDGRLHSAHFIELSDQPVEVTLALNPEQCDTLFARLSSGESSVFSRRMILLHVRVADARDGWALFYGTPIRTQHCENYIRSFERLLRSATGCDPEGMIVDALHGNAQGRLYRVLCELRDSPSAGGPAAG